MHILLTDILTCPRCGPDFGLILLADEIVQRRVLAGTLGCPNCRAHYPLRHGAVHCGGEPVLPAGSASNEAAIRLAALIGLEQGSRYVLLAGPAAAHAPALAALADGVEVIVVGDPDTAADVVPPLDRPGVTMLGIGARLPLASGRVHGIALTGPFASALLEEGARVLAPPGRLLLEPGPTAADARLAAAGLHIVARDATAVVAVHA